MKFNSFLAFLMIPIFLNAKIGDSYKECNQKLGKPFKTATSGEYKSASFVVGDFHVHYVFHQDKSIMIGLYIVKGTFKKDKVLDIANSLLGEKVNWKKGNKGKMVNYSSDDYGLVFTDKAITVTIRPLPKGFGKSLEKLEEVEEKQ